MEIFEIVFKSSLQCFLVAAHCEQTHIKTSPLPFTARPHLVECLLYLQLQVHFKPKMIVKVILVILGIAGACPPKPTPLGEIISQRNDRLIEENLSYNHQDFESQNFYDTFCPKQAHEAQFFNNISHQNAGFDSTAEKRLPILVKKSNLMFEILLHDFQHRDILCQVAILEHSGRGQTRGCSSRQASKQAMERIMIINQDSEHEFSVSGGVRRLGGGGEDPPTPPPNKKPKLPDDKIVYDVTDDEDDEDDKENVDGNDLPLPVSRLDSSSSCASSDSASSSASVVNVIFLNPSHPHFQSSTSETRYYRGVARGYFPISIYGNREVPRDSINSIPLPYDPQTGLTELYGINGITPTYTHSCNIDSFLTHLIVLSNLDPQLANKIFVTQNSRLENGLRNILQRYWTGIQAGESITAISDDVKGMWIKTANLPYRKIKNNQPVEMYGSEYNNVFEPLQQNSILASIRVCKCPGAATHRISVRNVLRNRFCKSADIARYSANSGHKMYKKDKCDECVKGKGDEFQYYFTADTTWFLAFECPADVYTTIEIDRLPLLVRIPDAFRVGHHVEFGLGYLSYSTEHSAQVSQNAATSTFHQVSFHFINNEWFFYDDTEGGQLRKITSPNAILSIRKLAFQAAVYFRKRNN